MDFNQDDGAKELGFYTTDQQYGNMGCLGGAFTFLWCW